MTYHPQKKIKGNLLLSFLFLLLIFSCSKKSTPQDDTDPTPDTFQGEIDWVKTYGGSGEDEAIAVTKTIDGGLLILGTTNSIDGDISGKTSTDKDFWLLKLDSDGTKVWDKTLGGSDDDIATAIIQSSQGGYILSGYSRSNDGDVGTTAGFFDYWIIKIDENGTKQWSSTFGFPGTDQATKIIETREGGYFVTGFFDVTASGGQGNDGRNSLHGVGEYWGIKLDASGNYIWRRYFGGSNNDRSYDVIQTTDSGFLLVGSSESDDFDITDDKGSYDFWVVKVSKDGDTLWTKSYGGSEIENGRGLTQTQDGNYLFVGDTRSTDQDVTGLKGNADAWVIKFNGDNGNLIWQKTFGGSEFDSASDIQKLTNGNFAICGNSRSSNDDLTNNNGQNDAWLFIIDPNGTLKFQKNIGGSALDFSSQVIEMSNNELIIVGNTESNDQDIATNKGIKDFLIVKLK